MIDPVKSIASARKLTLILLSYCIAVFLTLAGLGYAVESGLFLSSGYNSDQVDAVSSYLRMGTLFNYMLLIESVVSLVTIIRQCRCFLLYRITAWAFIVGRFVAMVLIIYEGASMHQPFLAMAAHLWRLKFYATLLGLFEVMIVALQMLTVNRLRRKLQLSIKELEEEV